MGAGSSLSPDYEAAVSVFNEKEHELIKGIFDDCSEGEKTVVECNLHNHLKKHLSSTLTKRLYDTTCHILTENRTKGELSMGFTLESFTVMLACALKGTLDQRCHILMSLAKRNSRSSEVTGEELMEAITHLLSSYMKMMTSCRQHKSWKIKYRAESDERMVHFLVKDIVDAESPLEVVSEGDVEKWLSKSAFISHMMDYVFYTCFPVSYVDDVSELRQCTPKVPECRDANWAEAETLLDLSSLVFLNHSVPVQLSKEWRLLFNSRTHGESFSTMLKYITNRGPSVLVVKDKDGHVFGGFASESWTPKPNFYGSPSCFLFTLSPHVGRFYPGGVNQNYLYLNNGQQTLPNGLGFGGQFSYFGLWLDAEYGLGESHAEPTCSTYTSPRLSREEKFTFDYLEVWGVGPEPGKTDESKHSILDEDPAAKAMLSLIGKGPVSEGLRETDATAESPGEHALPPM